MKKLLATSVLASSMLFPNWANAANLSFPLNVTAEKKVELHKGATSSYPVMATLNPGQQVTVTDEFTNSTGEVWYHVNLGNAKGWGISTLFSESSTTVKSSAVINGNAIVNETKVNFRKGASTSYPVAGTLAKGVTVKVIDSFKNSAGEQWYRINYKNQTGWVLGVYLTPSTAAASPSGSTAVQKTVYANSAIVRKGATASYAQIGTLSKNQQVTLLDTFTNSLNETWYRVQSGSLTGWVISTAFNQAAETKTVYANVAIVRKGATTGYARIGTLSKNQQVTLLDTFTNSLNETWYRVQSGSLTGWVISTVFDPNAASASSSDDSTATDPTQPTNPTDSTQPTTPTEPVEVGQSLVVGTHNTYLYNGAGTSNNRIQLIPFKSTVTVLGQSVNAANETWINVEMQNGATGWTPKSDLVNSIGDLTYIYAENNAVIRKGASANYAAVVTLKANDQLLVLRELNGWYNVETTSGKRGWILKTQTSPISLNQLLSPTTYADPSDSKIHYLVWQKPSNFKFTYSTSTNQLIVKTGVPNVELPDFAVTGIQSVTSSGTTSKNVTITFAPGYTYTIRNYSDKVSIKVMPAGLAGKRIIVDAGHGGTDTGAIGPTGLREKDVNLAVALLVKSELEKAGAIVTLTRSTDTFITLQGRTAIANTSNADAFVAIHCDSYSASSKGTTTYYNTSINFNGPASVDIAQDIQNKVYTSLGTYNKGIMEQEFYVNRMNELPSVLVELAYISNPNEEALLRTTSFRQKAAVGIKNGLAAYFSGVK